MPTTPSPALWLTDYRDVLEALRLDDSLEQAGYDLAKTTVFDNVLLTLGGERHHRRRALEQRLFRPKVIRLYDDELIPAIAADEVARAVSEGVADLVTFSRRITTRLAAVIVGLDGCARPAAVEELAGYMAKLHEGATVLWSNRPYADLEPEVLRAMADYGVRFFEPSRQRRARLVDQVRRGEADADDLPSDLMTLILLHGAAEEWDDDQILRETIHYLIAAGHTSSAVLVHAVDDLLSWWAQHPEHRSLGADPRFLNRAVAETLRLHAPSSAAYRRASTAIQLSSGVEIAEGQFVGIDLVSANRDTAIFGDRPEVFDPFRTIQAPAAPFGLSFGGGQHNCPGRQLAAGQNASSESAAGNPVFGIITRILTLLIGYGVERHGEPARNPNTAREQYLSYPLAFAYPDFVPAIERDEPTPS